MSQSSALITGASTGIGFELARILAREGNNLILVAKSSERLKLAADKIRKEFPSIQCETLEADLASSSAPVKLADAIRAKNWNVDILVNSAGYGDFGSFLETSLEKELQMMQLNMVTLVHLTKLFVKGMTERKRGRILNVASTAAFQPGPFMAIYYASKAFVLSFSEALNNELKGTGVSVTALCPGPTESNFTKAANLEGNKLFKSGVMDARAVAEVGYRGLMSSKSVVIPGLRNRVLASAVRFMPRDLVTQFSRKAVN